MHTMPSVKFVRNVAIIGLLLYLAFFSMKPVSAEGPKLGPGAKVNIIGPGYYDPDCYGWKGQVWEFMNNMDHFASCSRWIPVGGSGVITAGEIGYFWNNCYRVKADGWGGFGWYPLSSLEIKSLPLRFKK